MSRAAAVTAAIAMTTSNRKMAISISSTVGLGAELGLSFMAGRCTGWAGNCEGQYYANRVKLRPSLLLRRPEGLTVPASGSWGLASLGPVNPAFAGLL